MARLIDADQAVAEADRLLEHYNLAMANAENNREINHVFKRQELFKAVRAVVNTCPTIDPVKHGEWVFKGNGNADCSCCGYRSFGVYDDDNADRYCRHCGAKMDKKEDTNHDH